MPRPSLSSTITITRLLSSCNTAAAKAILVQVPVQARRPSVPQSLPCSLSTTCGRYLQHSSVRAFSTTMATKQEWLVILPDRPGMLEKRKEIRPTHLQNVGPEVKSGKVLIGGATLARPLQEGQPPEMTGSAFITVADTHADVLAFLKDDVYATAGVWDLDKVQIIPFRTAVRKGLPDLGTAA